MLSSQEESLESTSHKSAESDVSRRDLIARGLPALALGAGLMSAGGAFAQDQAGDAPVKSVALDMLNELHSSTDGAQYTLPKLPYAYDALEPHIDSQTMELHHSKHQQAYVSGLNKAIDALGKLTADAEIDSARLAGLTRDVSFNAGGALLHTIFFATMAKPAGDKPDNAVTRAIAAQYGSMEKFQAHFSKVAGGVKGAGWAIAFYEPVGGRILISDVGDQDNRVIPGAMPLLLIDVWEHAYYLKYQNKRADYIKAWWNVVNWDEVANLYTRVREIYSRRPGLVRPG